MALRGNYGRSSGFNFKRMTHAQDIGRLLFMSWNAGGGARKLPALLDQLGHDVVAIQEAHQEQMMQLEKLNWGLQRDQCIVVRKPNNAQTIAHGGNNEIWWHVAEFFVERALLGLKGVVCLSLHLRNMYAKRAVAGPTALQEAIDAAIHACEDAGRPSLDIVCGDITMARWKQ